MEILEAFERGQNYYSLSKLYNSPCLLRSVIGYYTCMCVCVCAYMYVCVCMFPNMAKLNPYLGCNK